VNRSRMRRQERPALASRAGNENTVPSAYRRCEIRASCVESIYDPDAGARLQETASTCCQPFKFLL
jgi:hypothetical protein